MLARVLRKLRFPLLGAAAGALVLVTTTALAGSGVGGVLNLGQLNTVDAQTALSGNPGSNPQLKLTNTGTNAGIRVDSQTGIGVNGVSVSGTGQQGQSQSGIGLLGIHAGSTGLTAGVEGRTASTDQGAAGVLGRNTGGGPGLRAVVNAGAPPLAVNSSVKVASLNADLLDGLNATAFWQLGGNAGTTPGTNFIGTTDNQALELKVDGQRALRLEPATGPSGFAPNVIGGWAGNAVADGASGATIAGGGRTTIKNLVTDDLGTIGGGEGNIVGDADGNPDSVHGATVAGGVGNTASGLDSTIAGGVGNTASGSYSTVAGGFRNTAGGDYSAVVSGNSNTASGGDSTVAGGVLNTASGSLSFAAGSGAQATQDGSFVWGDGTFAVTTSPAPNTFSVRALGGIWLGTGGTASIRQGAFLDTSTGGYLSSGGDWVSVSDRAKKHDFRRVDPGAVLAKVGRMPISSWSYKAEQPSVRHLGPTAQDFYRAFRLGLDNKHIGAIDEGGVALAAIQGLYRQNEALERQNRAQARVNAALRRQSQTEDARLARLERALIRLDSRRR